MLSTVRRLFLGGMVGKLTGVFREILAAWLFGTGMVAAAFRLSQAAFLIPVHGFVSDAVSAGFTPNFTLAHKRDPKAANQLFCSMHLVMLSISVVVAALLIAFANIWVALLAPGFDHETSKLAVSLVRILGLSMPAYTVVSLYASVDLAISGGRITAARATVQSIGLIVGTVAAYLLKMPELIAAGFVSSYYFLVVWGVKVVRAAGLNFFPRRAVVSPDEFKSSLLLVWKPFKILIWVPIFLQVNQIIERRVASLADPGAVAAIDYAKFISDTLIILLAVPFAVAGLSHMVSMSEEKFRHEALRGFKTLCLLGIPVSTFFFLHATSFVELVFMRGSFDQHSVKLTASILSAVAPGIVFQLLGYSGSRFLSGRHRNKEVLLATCAGIVANVSVNLLLGDYLGAASLGWGMTANALIFGGLAVARVGLIGQIISSSFVLLVLAAIYSVLSYEFKSVSPFFVCVFSAIYWIVAILAWPPYRKELLDLARREA